MIIIQIYKHYLYNAHNAISNNIFVEKANVIEYTHSAQNILRTRVLGMIASWYRTNFNKAQQSANHDDVIKWKHFRVTGLCTGNSPVTGEFPAQRPVTRSFDVFFNLRLE